MEPKSPPTDADREHRTDSWYHEQRLKATALAANICYAVLQTANAAGISEAAEECKQLQRDSILKMLDRLFRYVKRIEEGPKEHEI